MVGAILIASALIFGAVAGGVVVHRLHAGPTASNEQQGEQGPEKSPAPAKQNQESSQENQNNHDSAEQGDHQDKDA